MAQGRQLLVEVHPHLLKDIGYIFRLRTYCACNRINETLILLHKLSPCRLISVQTAADQLIINAQFNAAHLIDSPDANNYHRGQVQKKNTSGTAEFCAISVFALILFLPYRAIQYDANGIEEARYIEGGQLFQKNHMLYRPASYAVYSAAKTAGYRGNALGVLQVLSAIFGAIGVGLCYLLCESRVKDRLAALVGAFWLGTSFTYWCFSTDAGYIVLAGVFVLGALVAIVRGKSWTASIVAALAVLTWQANIFAVPVIATITRRPSNNGPTLSQRGRGNDFKIVPLPLGEGGAKRRVRVAVATILLIAIVYISIALLQGYSTPAAILHWVSTYGEGSIPLPLWGTWAWDRIPAASLSALRSIIPILLAARPSELTQHIQLGRIAVDISLIAFVVLLGLAALRADRKSLIFLAGYVIFLPFIIWWDPYEPKWFLVPNIFLAGFLASSLAPWLGHKYMRVVVLGSVLAIAATNFITTIRPRHTKLGPDREMARCVADKMNSNDLFVSAEWGWSEYLGYLHGRQSVNLINDGISNVKERIRAVRDGGGNIFMLDPGTYSQEHMEWLRNQTGLRRDDLMGLFTESQAVTPPPSCR